jgi:hypothetical protein
MIDLLFDTFGSPRTHSITFFETIFYLTTFSGDAEANKNIPLKITFHLDFLSIDFPSAPIGNYLDNSHSTSASKATDAYIYDCRYLDHKSRIDQNDSISENPYACIETVAFPRPFHSVC